MYKYRYYKYLNDLIARTVAINAQPRHFKEQKQRTLFAHQKNNKQNPNNITFSCLQRFGCHLLIRQGKHNQRNANTSTTQQRRTSRNFPSHFFDFYNTPIMTNNTNVAKTGSSSSSPKLNPVVRRITESSVFQDVVAASNTHYMNDCDEMRDMYLECQQQQEGGKQLHDNLACDAANKYFRMCHFEGN